VTLEREHVVTLEMSPPHLPGKVLSTPSMVGLIEVACLDAAQAHLDDNETTVGTHVCVSHAAAVKVGDSVTVSCELTEVSRRRLTFSVAVRWAEGEVSSGTHQRAVVDASVFG
jgi:fluoroacetyl-CoA thioesterase